MGQVVYGRFGGGAQGQAGETATAEQQAGTPPMEHPLKELEQHFASVTAILGELASLLADPSLAPDVAGPLFTDLVALQATGHQIALKLRAAPADDQAFLLVQNELKAWGDAVQALEQRALTQTGHEMSRGGTQAPIEVNAQGQMVPQPKPFPVVWVGVGTLALGGLAWFAINQASKKKSGTGVAVKSVPFKKVKLKRALPAR